MRTETGPVTIATVEHEPRRTFSVKRTKDSRLTSPTTCPQIKVPESSPNLTETDGACCRAERGSYQLKITGTSSAISAVGSASLSLEQAVMLVLAVEKFKLKLKRPSRDGWVYDGPSLTDADLLGNFDALLEDAITCTSYGEVEQAACSFRFMRSEQEHLTDDQDRSLILSENLQLLAMSLQQSKDAVQLDVRYYKTTPTTEDDLPVVMAISNQNLFLSCVGTQDSPRVQLEKWDRKLQNISSTTDLLRFVFFKKVSSSGLHFELESAMYRGWYVSTSRRNRQPIELDEKKNHKRITIFTAD
ncbi:interleukin-1 beta isoform X2 [Scyliorhinus canicula]|uniref:interleukin-1 beta isoform X2 n=1 Tax=Scyliorhinus canicula TaxID=7830 RepID=UPI0018F3F94E|nr:interleukin-1 beta isoform X2 [Scyliorhinus canicula]